MKRWYPVMFLILLLVSCASTEVSVPAEMTEEVEKIVVRDMEDIRTVIRVGDRLCTLTLSTITGEKSIMISGDKGYMTYTLSEIPTEKFGTRYLYSTAGNINIIIRGRLIYISAGTEWCETYIESVELSPFVFATHA